MLHLPSTPTPTPTPMPAPRHGRTPTEASKPLHTTPTTTALKLAFFIALLLLCESPSFSHAAFHEVTEWSAEYGFCKAEAGTPRRLALPPVTLTLGDTVLFKFVNTSYSSPSAGKKVLKYPTKQAWNECDEVAATLIASGTMGGNCVGDWPGACATGGSGFEETPPTKGTFYYAAEKALCKLGVKLKVSVVAADDKATSTYPKEPRTIEIPYWTDDYGYCGDVSGITPRPTGYPAITVFDGDTLLFKYSLKHNVYVADDHDAYESCAKERMQLVADNAAGGGCSNDASMSAVGDNCLANSIGFKYTASLSDKRAMSSSSSSMSSGGGLGAHLLLLCQVHDHCDNGQKIVVNILPRPSSSTEPSRNPGDSSSSSSAGAKAGIATLVVALIGAVCAIIHQRRQLAILLRKSDNNRNFNLQRESESDTAPLDTES